MAIISGFSFFIKETMLSMSLPPSQIFIVTNFIFICNESAYKPSLLTHSIRQLFPLCQTRQFPKANCPMGHKDWFRKQPSADLSQSCAVDLFEDFRLSDRKSTRLNS